MVEQGLLERALRLDEGARRELISLLQGSLDHGEISPEVATIIDQRVAEADANPDDFTPLDEFEREVRARRTV
ncbi:hypothetical protein [Pseudolysinimonas yzui]|uniref:Addiction module protein n=1 Tax=Pseudolysinimonas yzui TaxID=2708254 RepID=A0A8J3GPY7_9MICO|nr:hypothetical protein [Pseudolysinimonas yzui]GHF12563.1 hypothetical protein GCM10011600_11680 [Pseudolysinimonas yzui]